MDGNGGKKELLDLLHQQFQTPTAKERSLWDLLRCNFALSKIINSGNLFPEYMSGKFFPHICELFEKFCKFADEINSGDYE